MLRELPDSAYKFYLVMPMEADFAASEGTPEAGFPCTDFCRIAYSVTDAEKLLLELQEQYSDRDYVMLESTAWCEKVQYEHPVYRIAEPQAWE